MNPITFAVSDGERAPDPLPEVRYHEAVAHLLSQPLNDLKEHLREMARVYRRCAADGGEGGRRLAECERQLAEAEAAGGPVALEACSRYHGRLVAGVVAHPVIAALHRAFQQHRPVTLSPDAIWLLVCQGVAHHVHARAEDLRPRLVRHAGKLLVEVRRDDFVLGSPENPWAEVVEELGRGVREHVGPAADRFAPRFSTTGPADRAAAGVVLLSAVRSYFDYRLVTMCGIPAVTLEGTADDWRELAERAEGFADLDLDWWLTPLRPVLREFAAAARGDVRREFWASMYKYRSFSGGSAVSGWVNAFFPYFKDDRGDATRPNPWLTGGGSELARLLAGRWKKDVFNPGGPDPGDFPGGLASAPFVWEYLGRRLVMEFLGGFVGVSQHPDTRSLRPEVGWAVRRVPA